MEKTTIANGQGQCALRISDESRFNQVAISIAGEMPDSDPALVHGTGAYWKVYLICREGCGIQSQHCGGFTRDNVPQYASFGTYSCLTFAELTDAMQAGDLIPQWGIGVAL